MKETTYKCDICENDRNTEDLIGINNTILAMGGNKTELVDIQRTVENSRKHICTTCIGIIYAYQKKEIERGYNKEERIA